VTEKTCEATTDGMKTQLSDIKTDIEKLFDKMDSLDRWLREHSYSGNLKI